MAVVTSLWIGQSISCLMLPDPLSTMHTNAAPELPSSHYFRFEISPLLLFSFRIFCFRANLRYWFEQLMRQSCKHRRSLLGFSVHVCHDSCFSLTDHFFISLHHFQGPLSPQRVIRKIVIFTTGNSQWHFNGSFCALFSFVYSTSKKLNWKDSSKVTFFHKRQRKHWWSFACLYITHISIISLVKQPRGGTTAAKEEAFREERWDETFSHFKMEENIRLSDVVGNICHFTLDPNMKPFPQSFCPQINHNFCLWE